MSRANCRYCGTPLHRPNPSNPFCSVWCRTQAIAEGLYSPGDGESRRAARPMQMRGHVKMRACHDCGRPTVDYRCPQCWEKLRKSLDISTADTNLLDAEL